MKTLKVGRRSMMAGGPTKMTLCEFITSYYPNFEKKEKSMSETKWRETEDVREAFVALENGLKVESFGLSAWCKIYADGRYLKWADTFEYVPTEGNRRLHIEIPAPKPEFVDCKVESSVVNGDLRVKNALTRRSYGLSEAVDTPGFAGYVYPGRENNAVVINDEWHHLSTVPRRVALGNRPALTPAFVRFYAV